MTTDLPVSLAFPSDEEELMEMCRALDKENGLFPMSENRVLDQLRQAFNKRGGIIGVIREGNDKIQGMIYILIAQMWCSDEWHLEELFNWVRPEYRRSNNAKNLIRFAMKCSDELDLTLLIGVVSNIRTEAKIELYKRAIKSPDGAFFVYNRKRNEEAA